jgi:hypothetical protein
MVVRLPCLAWFLNLLIRAVGITFLAAFRIVFAFLAAVRRIFSSVRRDSVVSETFSERVLLLSAVATTFFPPPPAFSCCLGFPPFSDPFWLASTPLLFLDDGMGEGEGDCFSVLIFLLEG